MCRHISRGMANSFAIIEALESAASDLVYDAVDPDEVACVAWRAYLWRCFRSSTALNHLLRLGEFCVHH